MLPIGAPLGVASGVGMIAGGVQNGFFGQSQILAKHEDIDNIPPSLTKLKGGSTSILLMICFMLI